MMKGPGSELFYGEELALSKCLMRYLEREGCSFSRKLLVTRMSHMGGGVGVVAREACLPRTRLITVGYPSMLTVGKARLYLALVEVEYSRGYGLRSRTSAGEAGLAKTDGNSASDVPFTVRFCSKVEPGTTECYQQVCGCDLLPRGAGGHSSRHEEDVRRVEERLRVSLGPAETLAACIAMMAALLGRIVHAPGSVEADRGTASGAGGGAAGAEWLQKSGKSRIFFEFENSWMESWVVEALPSQYDNGLEIFERHRPRGTGSEVEEALSHFFSFPRHARKVAEEQAESYHSYQRCLHMLQCLQYLPTGCRPSPTHSSGRTDSVTASGPLSFTQYLWALNTVASRGFGFPVETWVMIPLADYFNYRLLPTANMGAKKATKQQQQSWMPTMSRLSNSGSSSYVYEFTTCGGGEGISAGQEIQLCYGAYSDFELLLWYGFSLRHFLLPSAVLQAVWQMTARGASEERGEGSTLAIHSAGFHTSTVPQPTKDTTTTTHDEDELQRLLDGESYGDVAAVEFPSHEERIAEVKTLLRGFPLLFQMTTARDIFSRVQTPGHTESEQRHPKKAAPATASATRKAWVEWRTALQTAYCHVLSPLVNIEGEATTSVVEGERWLTRLFTWYSARSAVEGKKADTSAQCWQYYQRLKLATGGGNEIVTAEDEAKAAALEMALQHALQCSSSSSSSRSSSSSGGSGSGAMPSSLRQLLFQLKGSGERDGLGCLHPTPSLQQVLWRLGDTVARRVTKQQRRTSSSSLEEGYVCVTAGVEEAWQLLLRNRKMERGGAALLWEPVHPVAVCVCVDMVRYIAWAELCRCVVSSSSSMTLFHSSSGSEKDGDEEHPSPQSHHHHHHLVSQWAALKAVHLSLDVFGLLYFLSVRATAAELVEYVCCLQDYGDDDDDDDDDEDEEL